MSPKPLKAYKNLEFLNSSEARTLRILSEFLEPAARFRKEKVVDTVVFFGSARTLSEDDARAALSDIRKRFDGDDTPEAAQAVRHAEKRVELARYYEDARTLARKLTQWSIDINGAENRFVIASGGGPGIMEAANRGASEVEGGRNIGLNISIPMEQDSNPYITPDLNFEFHYFFARKFWFIYLAKALVVFPGGFGTMDELFEVLTLLQTRKLSKRMPVVIYGTEYWNRVINFEAMVENQMINEADLQLIHFSDSPDDAFEYLANNLTNHKG